MEEATTSTQDFPEEPGPLGSGVDEAGGRPNLHGLTGSVGQIALDAPADKLLGQMEQKTP